MGIISPCTDCTMWTHSINRSETCLYNTDTQNRRGPHRERNTHTSKILCVRIQLGWQVTLLLVETQQLATLFHSMDYYGHYQHIHTVVHSLHHQWWTSAAIGQEATCPTSNCLCAFQMLLGIFLFNLWFYHILAIININRSESLHGKHLRSNEEDNLLWSIVFITNNDNYSDIQDNSTRLTINVGRDGDESLDNSWALGYTPIHVSDTLSTVYLWTLFSLVSF
jgi:hypothetical protein